jgi:hypothetical protein
MMISCLRGLVLFMWRIASQAVEVRLSALAARWRAFKATVQALIGFKTYQARH